MSFNDPQWGRSAGSDKPRNDEQENQQRQDQNQPDPNDENKRREEADRQASDNDRNNMSDRRGNRNEGNDLDQLWNDFNRMVNSILGGQKDPRGNRQSQDAWQSRRDDETPREEEQPAWRQDDHQTPPPPRTPRARRGFGRDPKSFSVRGIAGLIGVAAIAWLASGIYIVPEGQIGVVTTFGKYTQDSAPGINWRLPWPVQDVEIVDVSSVRKAEIGMRGTTQRLKEALMLTDDENIVDVMFNVQYRIKPHAAKDYLFRSRDPDRSVFDAAESAMREVVGRKTMDSVLFESKQEIASAVQVAMQAMLDRYQTGIEVMSVAIQNAQPPQQVQAAFNDAVKAGQDRERQINEGQAYANDVIPKARGMAARLAQEAEGYKARVVETAKPIMNLVPEDYKLEAEVQILNKDIGFVRPEQDVEIKIDSFSFTKYGTIKGKVRNISGDAIQDEKLGLVFNARLTLLDNKIKADGQIIQLKPGMSVTAEIKTGKRRVIEYLLSPVMKYLNESMRER